ncbi:MAG TPA: aminotransferase class V-fold PLP-dependent enzyme [Acidimicrobiales bacterium]|nr:aminotransferase class V-fold PLP-dependent enzyme [Acidimicrobiales bacterium]
MSQSGSLPVQLVGDEVTVPCADGTTRRYVNLDTAASTGALPAVAERVQEFLPLYSSVHRGAGYKSQLSTGAYEEARAAALRFAGRDESRPDVAIICRNTTEAINHLAYRLRLDPHDIVVTTVVEHHADLLPWARLCRRQYVECDRSGTFGLDAVTDALDAAERPKLLAMTGASNVTGWQPPVEEAIREAHDRGIPVLVDGAQLAPHRPLPPEADFVAWSGHKMYAPFGAGVLIGPRAAFADGDPFLAGGGAVDLVDLDEVAWSQPPEREEAGSPNVIGAVALHAAMDHLRQLGWDAIHGHDDELSHRMRAGLAAIPGVRLLGPAPDLPTLPIATFTVTDVPHALVAARLSFEYGIGVRHGCFCAHPYLIRLLGLSEDEVHAYRRAVRAGDRRAVPGAVRASAGINTSVEDVDRLLGAVAHIASRSEAPFDYVQDPHSGDYRPPPGLGPWEPLSTTSTPCAVG